MSLNNDPIIILGMFRGGTSCLSTVLAALGVHLGNQSDFQSANEFNEGGYWELEDMQALNLRAMYVYGMNALGADRLPENWSVIPGTEPLLDDLGAMLEKHFAGHQHWGWKEPGTTDLLPLYKQVMETKGVQTPRYAISVRHPLSVASSRKRQFDIKTAKAAANSKDSLPPNEQRTVGIWVHYMLVTLRETRGAPRLMLSYEDFLRDPAAHVERIVSWLPWKPQRGQIDAAANSIKPSWSHSRFSLEDLDSWPSIVRRTYELCLRCAGDPAGLNGGKFDDEVEELWREWNTVGNMVRNTTLPTGSMILSWREAGTNKHAKHEFTPTGGWQVAKCSVTAPAGETVQINPYQMACQVWIKSAVWIIDGQRQPAALMAGPTGILERPEMIRLTAFGSSPLVTKVPARGNSVEFELEFLLQFDIATLNSMVYMLRDRLEQSKRDLAQHQQPRPR